MPRRPQPRFNRLTAADVANLTVEAADTPMHVGVVALLDGAGLLDPTGELLSDEILSRLRAGVRETPVLREALHRGGFLSGRPVWVDDPAFDLGRHVDTVHLEAPGGEEELLRLVERLMEPLLNRSFPLWHVWLVSGLADGRVPVVVKLHHAVADGLAAVGIVSSLLGQPSDASSDAPQWVGGRVPTWIDLVWDNALATGVAVRRMGVSSVTAARWADAWRSTRTASETLRRARRAPKTSLNAPVGPRRRLGVVRMDLVDAKKAGHAHGGTVNDLVLDLVAGGLRALLASRGEPVEALVVHAAVAVSTRRATGAAQAGGQNGNQAGVIVVPLLLGLPGPGPRLREIVAATSAAKRDQSTLGGQAFMALLARLGLTRYVTRHQHLTNVVVSDVTGPPNPITALGATAVDVLPVGVVAGNLSISFLAFSYAGQLTISVWCDADQFPDLSVLLDAMRRDWAALSRVAV